jgi:hypothetical protein
VLGWAISGALTLTAPAVAHPRPALTLLPEAHRKGRVAPIRLRWQRFTPPLDPVGMRWAQKYRRFSLESDNLFVALTGASVKAKCPDNRCSPWAEAGGQLSIRFKRIPWLELFTGLTYGYTVDQDGELKRGRTMSGGIRFRFTLP